MGHLIKGKQLQPNSLLANLLYTTGSTATAGQLPSYDATTSGFTWVDNTGGVTSVSGNTALDQSTTTGDVVLDVRTDNLGIFVDGSNNLTLGDPNNNNLISGGDYIFDGSVTVNADFTVLGTATTVNTEHLYVEDNIITLNSTFTAGTPTLNAGLEVLRGNEPTVVFRWNESNQWWEVTNPEGTGNTYSAILTTASVESDTDSSTLLGVDVRQGTASDADKLFLGVSGDGTTILTSNGYLEVGTIQNSNLANSAVTINTSTGLAGGGTVGLGESITLSATSTWSEVLTNGNTSGGNNPTLTSGDQIVAASGDAQLDLRQGADNTIYLGNNGGGFSGQTLYLAPSQSSLNWSDDASTYSTVLATADYASVWNYRNGKNNAVTAWSTTGATLFDNRIEIASTTGSITMTAGTGNIYILNSVATDNALTSVLARDPADGKLREVSVSALTGDIYTTGATINNSTGLVTFTRNDANTYSFSLSGTDFNDTYVTGGSITTSPSPTDENGVITLAYNNDEGGTYTLPFTDKFVISGFVSDTDLILALNDGTNAVPIDLSSLDVNDTFSTGGTISYDNADGTINIVGNAGFTPYSITGITDVQTTGGTYAAGTITFTQNDGTTYQVTGLDSTDTFVTGGTVSSGSLTLDLNDASTVNVTGTIIQSVSGNSPITASTTNGAVSVGLDYSSLQLAVPTTSDKGLSASANTSGNGIIPGVTITEGPVNGGQVNMTINSAYYVIGETTGDDIYFTTDAGSSAVAFASLVGGENIYWKGSTIGFDIETTDTINLHYNILQ
jgi:hypothetical protein